MSNREIVVVGCRLVALYVFVQDGVFGCLQLMASFVFSASGLMNWAAFSGLIVSGIVLTLHVGVCVALWLCAEKIASILPVDENMHTTAPAQFTQIASACLVVLGAYLAALHFPALMYGKFVIMALRGTSPYYLPYYVQSRIPLIEGQSARSATLCVAGAIIVLAARRIPSIVFAGLNGGRTK